MGTYVSLSNSINLEFSNYNYNCIYNWEDYIISQHSEKGHYNSISDNKMQSHDVLFASLLDQNMVVKNDRLHLLTFIVDTLMLQKSLGFLIVVSEPYLLNIYREKLERYYEVQEIIIYDKKTYSERHLFNDYKTLFIGVRKGIKLSKEFNLFSKTEFNDGADYTLSILINSIENYKQQLSTNETLEIEKLKQNLIDLPYSKGKEYEELLYSILKLIFAPHFPKEDFDLREQVRNRGNIKIRDFLLYNSGTSHRFLKDLKQKGANFILFEAKNYSKKISPDELTNLKAYVSKNPNFGKIAFLITRKGISNNAKEDLFRDQLQNGFEVVVLKDEHILQMLDLLVDGSDPIRVIENEYKKLALQL